MKSFNMVPQPKLRFTWSTAVSPFTKRFHLHKGSSTIFPKACITLLSDPIIRAKTEMDSNRKTA